MQQKNRSTDEAFKELAFAIVKQAAADYIESAKTQNILRSKIFASSFELGGVKSKNSRGTSYEEMGKSEISERKYQENLLHWFRSDYCDLLLQDTVSADKIIRELQKRKQEHAREIERSRKLELLHELSARGRDHHAPQ